MQDVENQSFEELIENAKNIIARFGQIDVNLKEVVELYKNGMATLQKAQEMLESAKLEFEEIQKQSYDENTTKA